jgi:hypothetical protein
MFAAFSKKLPILAIFLDKKGVVAKSSQQNE